MAKTKLNITRENLSQDTERFVVMWEQAKTKLQGGEIIEDSISGLQQRLEIVKQKSDEWKNVMQQRDKLM